MTARGLRRSLAVLLIGALVGACSGGPLLANPPRPQPSSRPSPSVAPRPADPQPIELPRDDGPHDRLTEWWYFTGHLRDGFNERYGFEYVVFRAERGGFPVSWASHLALTDETRGTFHYAQRSEIGPQVDRSPADGGGFAFQLTGLDPLDATTVGRPVWRMVGRDGRDGLLAEVNEDEVEGDPRPAGFGISLSAEPQKAPALHDRDGFIDFGPAGGSYYYSRTSMRVTGQLRLGNAIRPAVGTAWFDHQWGDFISVGGGGWDWFAVNFEDGVEVTVSQVRAADGSYPLVYGTLVEADGTTRHLERDAIEIATDRTWTSPRTGATYPAGWTLTLPQERLVIRLAPKVAQQELDTRASTGVTYWEGSQEVVATRGAEELGGQAYVELTGYGP